MTFHWAVEAPPVGESKYAGLVFKWELVDGGVEWGWVWEVETYTTETVPGWVYAPPEGSDPYDHTYYIRPQYRKVSIFTYVANESIQDYGWDLDAAGFPATLIAEYPIITQEKEEITVHGYVEDGHGHRLEKVKVTLVWGSDNFTGYTDGNGSYQFDLEAGEGSSETAYLEVELTDEDGIIEIYDNDFSPDQVVRYQTGDFSLKSGDTWLGDVKQDIVFPKAADLPAPGPSGDQAVVYRNTYTAVKYYRDTLGATFDHRPVKVYTFCKEDTGFDPDTRKIYINELDTYATLRHAPQNREWHEFSHYVMWDIYGDFPPEHGHWTDSTWVWLDSSHGGFANHCTGDSWVEGFAIFMPLVIEGSTTGIYPVQDTKIHLECNLEDDTSNEEDFSVASILWDLYDPISSKDNDQVDLTIEQLWGVMTQRRTFPLYYQEDPTTSYPNWVGDTGQTEDRYISYVKDLYDALIASGLASRGAIDNIFISHGFYWDVNENGRYDAGENVGMGDYSRPERRNRRLDPKSSILVKVPAGIVPATLVVNVKFSPPFEGYDYSYEVPITSASQSVLVWMPPTDYPSTAYFTIQKEGYEESEPLTLSNDYYWSNVGLENHVLTHAFSLEPTEAPGEVRSLVVLCVAAAIAAIAFAIKRRR
jgi:hypothetical protein